ncbi:signal peptidase II [Sphingomonas paucimobilis]|uniref:signal peptidase II n=1 Tax=Sphingomonas paucimobilis TaxID=13689 RepID=UPI0009E56FE0|nr:signal peptidase II [Sphingomonas paucimobilis]
MGICDEVEAAGDIPAPIFVRGDRACDGARGVRGRPGHNLLLKRQPETGGLRKPPALPVAPLLTLVAVLTGDQLAKAAAFAYVASEGPVSVGPWLTITAGMNRGVAFGLATSTHPLLLVAIAAAISTALAIMIRRAASRLRQVGLAAILGGAVGNIADRVRFGAVRDLIDFHWGSWHWPTFNLADSFIFAGLVLILVLPEQSRLARTPDAPT